MQRRPPDVAPFKNSQVDHSLSFYRKRARELDEKCKEEVKKPLESPWGLGDNTWPLRKDYVSSVLHKFAGKKSGLEALKAEGFTKDRAGRKR